MRRTMAARTAESQPYTAAHLAKRDAAARDAEAEWRSAVVAVCQAEVVKAQQRWDRAGALIDAADDLRDALVHAARWLDIRAQAREIAATPEGRAFSDALLCGVTLHKSMMEASGRY